MLLVFLLLSLCLASRPLRCHVVSHVVVLSVFLESRCALSCCFSSRVAALSLLLVFLESRCALWCCFSSRVVVAVGVS
jgi:hypothetical protein